MKQEKVVRDNKEEHRFEMMLGEGNAAFIDYTEAGAGVLALTHTEVPEEFEGKGIGSRLVEGTFEIVRQDNRKFDGFCFREVYIDEHEGIFRAGFPYTSVVWDKFCFPNEKEADEIGSYPKI